MCRLQWRHFLSAIVSVIKYGAILNILSNVPNLVIRSLSLFYLSVPNSVSVSELTQLHKVLDFLEEYQNLLSASTILGDDVACPICYARPLSASFSPCGHMSCA